MCVSSIGTKKKTKYDDASPSLAWRWEEKGDAQEEGEGV